MGGVVSSEDESRKRDEEDESEDEDSIEDSDGKIKLWYLNVVALFWYKLTNKIYILWKGIPTYLE